MTQTSKNAAEPGRKFRPNECWAVELLRCEIRDIPGIAALFDLGSRLAVRVEITSGSAYDLTIMLEKAAAIAGYPEMLWMDSSLEFVSPELREWAERTGVDLIWGGAARKRLLTQPLRERLLDECLSKLPTGSAGIRAALSDWGRSIR